MVRGTGIYAIIDLLSRAIIGPLQLHKHEAAAVRVFTDALLDPDPRNSVHKHPDHYELIQLGWLEENDEEGFRLVPEPRGVLTGKQWLAAQPPEENGNEGAVRKFFTKPEYA